MIPNMILKILLSILGSLWLAVSPIDEIAKINKYKTEAEKAFKAENFEKAAALYSLLADSLNVREPEILLNLAHSYYRTNEAEKAQNLYAEVGRKEDAQPWVRSVAHQQLGVLSAQQKKNEEALEAFKQALKEDPSNEEARHNYELLKRLMEEEQEKQKDQDKQQQDENKEEQDQQDQEQNQDQQNQDQQEQNQQQQEQDEEQQDQQQQSQEGEQEEEKEQEQQQQQQEKEAQQSEEEKQKQQQQMQQQRMEEIKMSKEKAEMILNALRNQEIQYYQQLQKKSKKKQDDGKPDW